MAVVALVISCALTLGIAVRPAFADDQDCDALPTAVVHHPTGSRPQHVFIIVLENESYDETFGPHSKAPYLSKCLTKKGQLLTNYYAIGHFSLDNYIAMVSGQSPNPETQQDCPIFNEFALIKPGLDANGQAVGHGCVYPAEVSTIADQLEARHLKWRGYMEDMKGSCQHPTLGEMDPYERARSDSEYATKHNPFVYFHSISNEDCKANDVPLDQLKSDLETIDSTPNLSFIVPNLCNDGHDHRNGMCADGRTPGGLVAIDSFLRHEVPLIMNSKAYQQDGMLIVTFDEAELEGDNRDAHSCCGEPIGPNTQLAGVFGPGGGRIGAVIISSFVKPGIANTKTYNHYSLLRGLETLFGLSHLGYAEKPDPGEFGNDVYSQ
jgi:phosphatidylinositol-3-phosphatase